MPKVKQYRLVDRMGISNDTRVYNRGQLKSFIRELKMIESGAKNKLKVLHTRRTFISPYTRYSLEFWVDYFGFDLVEIKEEQ